MPTSFPPPYSIRISKRARRPGLRIAAEVGLEVVLPETQQQTNVPALLNRHKTWILRHYNQVMKPAKTSTPISDGFFINGGKVFIRLSPNPLTEETLRQRASTLLPGVITPRMIEQRPITIPMPPFENRDAFTKALRQWTLDQAATVFTPHLEKLLERQGLSINRCTFKLQKTRWGSCSSKRNININANILFLPENLARYVLIHEICHLYHLNHSPRFWKKVFELEPQALRFDKALRYARKYLPWDNIPYQTSAK